MKVPLVKMVKFDFSGLEFLDGRVVKVWRCPKYRPYSPVNPRCYFDKIDDNGFEKCREKRLILHELGIPERYSETNCGLYRWTYSYLKKFFERR